MFFVNEECVQTDSFIPLTLGYRWLSMKTDIIATSLLNLKTIGNRYVGEALPPTEVARKNSPIRLITYNKTFK